MPNLQKKVLEVAWWPKLDYDCRSWIKRCMVCKMIKGRPYGGSLWKSERYTAPFRVLMIDLIGKLTPKSEGCDHILTVIDVFSLWSWVEPLPNKKPNTVALKLFMRVYLDLSGYPLILRSDNGPEFTADVMKELNRLIGT